MSRTKIVAAPLKHVAIYLRVSTDEQWTDGYGMDTQLNETFAELQRRGETLAGVYFDGGVSGTKLPKDRVGMTSLLADIEAGTIGTVIIKSIDRLARKASVLLNVWEEIETKGAVVVSVKENIDTSTPFGRMMRSVLAAVAELERDMIVERTTAGRNQRAREDGDKGGALPYGYTRTENGVKVITALKPTIRRIFELRGQGLALRAIADNLNAASVASPKGSKWFAPAVKIVLDNVRAYEGAYRGSSPVRWPRILK